MVVNSRSGVVARSERVCTWAALNYPDERDAYNKAQQIIRKRLSRSGVASECVCEPSEAAGRSEKDDEEGKPPRQPGFESTTVVRPLCTGDFRLLSETPWNTR
jgi:hypothetical protein